MDNHPCPLINKLNCSNNNISCHKCRGETEDSSDPLLYKPINPSIPIHPTIALIKQEKKDKREVVKKSKQPKRDILRNSQKVERDLINKVGGIPTVCSGRLNGDGDGILIVNGNTYTLEVKVRKSLSISQEERKKADIFLISSSNYGDMAVMSISTLSKLLNQLNQEGNI
jgi:hypothetical protein